MPFSKSLAALSAKFRSKVTRKSESKVTITTISAPYNVRKLMSPVLEQMYDDELFLLELCNPTSPPHQPTFPIKHKVQLPSAHAEQHQPATPLSGQQQPSDLPSFNSELSNTSTYSSDANSQHHHDKNVPRCNTPTEQLFSPSAPASPNTSSRSTRTPSPIFDSVTSFDNVGDSPTLSNTTADNFTELPPCVFPLRRTARVQPKVEVPPIELPTCTNPDPFATLFSGPSPSPTHSLATSPASAIVSLSPKTLSLASFAWDTSALSLPTPPTMASTPSSLVSRLRARSTLASLAFADRISLEEDVKVGVVSVGQVSIYRSRALPAAPVVEHEGHFTIVEEW